MIYFLWAATWFCICLASFGTIVAVIGYHLGLARWKAFLTAVLISAVIAAGLLLFQKLEDKPVVAVGGHGILLCFVSILAFIIGSYGLQNLKMGSNKKNKKKL